MPRNMDAWTIFSAIFALRVFESVSKTCNMLPRQIVALKIVRALLHGIVPCNITLKADLHGTIFAYDCRMRFFIARAARVKEKSYTISSIAHFQKEWQTRARAGARSIMGSFGGAVARAKISRSHKST